MHSPQSMQNLLLILIAAPHPDGLRRTPFDTVDAALAQGFIQPYGMIKFIHLTTSFFIPYTMRFTTMVMVVPSPILVSISMENVRVLLHSQTYAGPKA